jgi:hypothetical protein
MSNEKCSQDVCVYRSSWTDSGDRGADMAEHNRAMHPDHEHVMGDSPYAWDQPGTPQYVSDPDPANYPRAIKVVRTKAVQRCIVCQWLPYYN